MGNPSRVALKAFALSAFVALAPLAAAHADDWRHHGNWGGGWHHDHDWHGGGYWGGGYGGDYGGGSFGLFFGGAPSYYYPPPSYYAPPPAYYYPPPQPYYAQPYYPPQDDQGEDD